MRTEAPPPCPPPCTSTAPCSTSYVSHTLRRTISARRVQPVSRPGREPAIAPAVTNSPDRARSPIASREILVSAKTGGIFFPGVTDRRARAVQAGIEPATYLFEIRRGEKAFSAKKPFAASDDVSPDLDPSSLPVNPQLIEKKVDLNAQDSDGWTALMYAVTVGGAEAVSKLVAAGVDQSAKNADGDTAMDLAKANAKRHNLIQILDPKEPMPTVAE